MRFKTLRQFLFESAQQQAGIDTELCEVIVSTVDACKIISHAVSQGDLSGVLGSLATENVQGEVQKKLDVMANDILIEAHRWGDRVRALASEELDDIQVMAGEPTTAKYLLLFDPLDGSSNIDVNVSIGTIFSILKADKGSSVAVSDFLQPGSQQLAAGYVLYGPQTQLVLTLGNGVHAFTLDRHTGSWLLSKTSLRIPTETNEFAINMSNQRHWEAPVNRYINDCLKGSNGPLGKDYNMRWVGSMVADVHRLLSRGGLFMYPCDERTRAEGGRLRLLYEANPMSFIVEQAGGAAIDGRQRLLECTPTQLHQRVGVILGSASEVARVQSYYQAG